MKILKVIIALVLCITAYNAESQSNDTHHVAIIDAGSTGSRIYIFSWNSVDESGVPKLAPVKSPESKQFGATTSPGIADPSFTHAIEAANSLIPLINYASSVLSPEELSKTHIFLNATAGMRLVEKEKRKAIRSAVRELFAQKHLMLPKDPKQAVRIIDGDEEGIYGWLGTNYFTGKFSQGDSTIGVLDLGGASTQITYATDKQSGPGIHTVKVGKKTFQLFSHSFLGLGMNEAYKTLANKECLPLHLRSQAEENTNSFETCVQSNSTHMPSAVHGDPSLLKPIKDPKIASSNFYLISGYKYIHDYLMQLQRDNSSSSWLDFFKKNGGQACTLSPKELLTSNPNVPELETQKYCFYSAYTVALLEKFGFDEHSHLEFKDKIPVDGQDVPLGWHLGAALLEAYKIQKSYDEATKPDGEPKKEKGGITSKAIDMGFFGIVDKAASDANVKTGIASVKGGVYATTNKVIGHETIIKKSDALKSWRELNPLSGLNYVKLEAMLRTYWGYRDPNKIWDLQSGIEYGVSLVELAHFIAIPTAVYFAGSATTALAIPGVPAYLIWGSAPAAALAKGANTLYFKMPAIRDRIDARIFGENLQEIGEVKAVYDWDEFADRGKQNNPYLKCNFYKSKDDLLNGAKTITSEFVKRDDFKTIFENETELFPASSYYNDWVILSGRWVRIHGIEKGTESYSAVRFASIDNPFSLLDICHSTLAKKGYLKGLTLEEAIDRIAPQAGYSSITASYPIYFYAKLKEKTQAGLKETARLIVGVEESEKQKKMDKLVGSFLAPDAPMGSVLQAHKIASHTDVKNRIGDNLQELLGILITSKRLFDPSKKLLTAIDSIKNLEVVTALSAIDSNNYFAFFDSFVATYGSANVIGKAFYSNQALSLDDITDAALGATTTGIMSAAGSPGVLSESKAAHIFQLWGTLANTVGKYGLKRFFNTNSLDEALHGAYLSGLKPTLNLNDLNGDKIQTSHLVCQYYPNTSSEEKIKDPLFTVWTPSSLLPKDSTVRVLPEHYYQVGTAVEKTEGPKQEFFAPLADNNGYIELKGRWVKTTDRGMVFATLADPAQVLSACVGALNIEELIPTEHRNSAIGAIIVSTGNTRATMGYAIEYYTPLVVWDGGEKTLKAVHLNEGTVNLAEGLLKKHSGK